MNWPDVALWGFVATTALTGLMTGSQQARLTRMSLPLMLGTVFTARWSRAKAVGFGIHFLNGWAFSLLYAWIFEAWGRASWWSGALLGVAHGLFILVVVIPLLPSVHPRMAGEQRQPEPTALLEPPGFLGLNYGYRTPLTTLLAHVAYGVVLGAFYRPV